MNTVTPPGQHELSNMDEAGKEEPAMSNGETKESHEGNNAMNGADPDDNNANTMATSPRPGPKKTIAFWSIIVALAFAGLLTALEATIVSTALPTIINVLGGGELYIWTVNIYFLTTYVPFSPL